MKDRLEELGRRVEDVLPPVGIHLDGTPDRAHRHLQPPSPKTYVTLSTDGQSPEAMKGRVVLTFKQEVLSASKRFLALLTYC
jgi:hypothetical protein